MITVEYHETAPGKKPAYEFLDLEPPEAINKILWEMKLLERHGLVFMMKDRDSVKKIHKFPLYELRVKVRRVLYRFIFIIRGDVAWFLSGFKKKTDKTPPGEIEVALERAKKI